MIQRKVALTEHDVVASLCRESFFDFVQEMWDQVIAEKPVWNWHIPYLCDELQYVAERVFAGKPKAHDLIINVPPGSTKSTIASVMFPAWVWTRMPSARLICGSYSQDLALDLSRKTRDLIESEKYKLCFPDITIRDDQNTKGYFLLHSKGGRKAVGTGSMITGFHGHFLIIDDPLNPKAARSETEAKLKEANYWMNETLPSRRVDPSTVPLILIMQRLHQNDPTGNRLQKGPEAGKVKHISIPADTTFDVQPPMLAKYYKRQGLGQPALFDPKRMPREFLDSQRKLLGEYGYSGQYGQSPVPPGGGMFRPAKLHISKELPHRWKRLVRYFDKAGTEGDGAYSAGVLMGIDEADRVWVLHVFRGQWEAYERERVFKQYAQMDKKKFKNKVRFGVEQEPGSGGKESAANTVKNLMGFRVVVDVPKGDKVLRADPFSAQVNGGNVWLLEGEWNSDYIDEMRYFPFSTYKDQIDASSGAFALLTGYRDKVGAF